MRPLLAGLVCLGLGCGGTTLVDAAKYKQGCTQSSDCYAVFSGDQCSVCQCPNAAVSTSVKDQFIRDSQAAQKNCGPRPAIACAECPPSMTVCLSQTCAVLLADGGTP